MGNFLDVLGADFFAEIGDPTFGIADFSARGRNSRRALISSALLMVRDEKFGFGGPEGRSRCAPGQRKTLLENRPIDLAKFRGGGGVLERRQHAAG